MSDEIVIFGAGRTGRGLVARLAAHAGRPVVLVDRDAALIAALRAAGCYRVRILGQGAAGDGEEIRPAACFHLDETGWEPRFTAAALAFTAVVGTNLPALGARLGTVLAGRAGGHTLSIVTCENDLGAARTLSTAMAAAAGGVLPSGIACVEAMVLTTCLGPTDHDPPLSLRSQDL